VSHASRYLRLILLASLITGSGMSLANDEPIAARMWDLRVLPSFRAVVPCLWIAVTVAGSSWRTWSFLGARSSSARSSCLRSEFWSEMSPIHGCFHGTEGSMLLAGPSMKRRGFVPNLSTRSWRTASSETIPTLQPVVRRPQDAHRRNITAFSDLMWSSW
jgi:hypothetical protein